MTSPRPSLLRHPDFLKLWTAETVSVFGSSITQLAIPIIAATTLQVTPFEFGLLTTLEMLPFILLTLPAGVWVDRLRRRPILIVADLGRAVMIASIPVAFYFDVLTIWQLYVVGFVIGCFTVFFDVAYMSYLPSVVERDQLVEGNSKLEITRAASQILGPGLAGALIAVLRAPFAMVLDALSFLFSAAFLTWIRRPEPPVPPHDETAHGPRPSMRREIAEGLRYVTGHRWLRAIAATTGISNFFGNVFGGIMILYLTRERGMGVEAIGLAFSVGAVGYLAAALVTTRLTDRLGVGRMLILSSLGFSIAWIPVPLVPDEALFATMAVCGLVGGFFSVAWNVNQVSLRQAITPPRMQGKMNATMRFIVWGTMPIGSLIGGALGSAIGLQGAALVGTLGGVVSFIPVAMSSVRSIVTMPEPLEEEEGAPAPVTAGV